MDHWYAAKLPYTPWNNEHYSYTVTVASRYMELSYFGFHATSKVKLKLFSLEYNLQSFIIILNTRYL